MATTKKDPEKTVDLPPKGARNPDPITDQPGSHPIETGVGAAVGGAAAGAALGLAVSGPLAPAGVVAGPSPVLWPVGWPGRAWAN